MLPADEPFIGSSDISVNILPYSEFLGYSSVGRGLRLAVPLLGARLKLACSLPLHRGLANDIQPGVVPLLSVGSLVCGEHTGS